LIAASAACSPAQLGGAAHSAGRRRSVGDWAARKCCNAVASLDVCFHLNCSIYRAARSLHVLIARAVKAAASGEGASVMGMPRAPLWLRLVPAVNGELTYTCILAHRTVLVKYIPTNENVDDRTTTCLERRAMQLKGCAERGALEKCRGANKRRRAVAQEHALWVCSTHCCRVRGER